MQRSTVEERKAYCQQHGHSWIKQSSQRQCSWCGEVERSEERLQSDARIAAAVREEMQRTFAYMTRCSECGKQKQPRRECCHRYLCDSCHVQPCKGLPSSVDVTSTAISEPAVIQPTMF